MSTPTTTSHARVPPPPARALTRHAPRPRSWGLRRGDVVAFLAANAVLITAMWVRHGGLRAVSSLATFLTAVGQLTGLYGTFMVLVQLLLMSRSPWLEQWAGRDRLVGWHRWVGFGSVAFLTAHTAAITLGYAGTGGKAVPSQFWDLLRNYPDVLMATVGLGLFFAVAATSMRWARRRLRYETWHAIHLYAYLAIALSFAHQFATGADFITDPAARIYWAALFVLTIGCLAVFRVGQPLWCSWRHRLRVAKVVLEAPGVASVHITGEQLDRLAAAGGQFFVWRFLTRDGWWKGHPFSLSAAPDGRRLRITVKAVGDGTREVHGLRPGVRVVAEGPYGALTADRRQHTKTLLVAGGIGITPLRALYEDLVAEATSPAEVVLLYRASRPEDVVFRKELDRLAADGRAVVHYCVGRRGPRGADPLGAEELGRLVPDIRQRDVYICGPLGMTEAVRQSVHRLGLTKDQIHAESFAY